IVCLETPNSRPISAAVRPASSCFNAPIISTSLYFLFAMPHLPAICVLHIHLCADFGEQVTATCAFSQETVPSGPPHSEGLRRPARLCGSSGPSPIPALEDRVFYDHE